MTKTVLITGTNRGIGLEFTKQYAQSGWLVYACCRDPNHAYALQTLSTEFANIKIIALDVSRFDQIDQLANQLDTIPLDLLINNAGVYPSSRIGDLDYDDWETAFKVNTMVPYKMIDAFLPNISKSH